MSDQGNLVRRIGDPAASSTERSAAERELCLRIAPTVRLYGLRHLRDDAAAADLVQEALIVLIEMARERRIEDPDHVDRFVLGTCRNLVSRSRRGERRTKTFERGVLPLEDAELPPAFTAVDAARLALCLGQVSARAQRVVLLAFQEERTADDIAAELETSAGNIRVLRHRAIAALQACMTAGQK